MSSNKQSSTDFPSMVIPAHLVESFLSRLIIVVRAPDVNSKWHDNQAIAIIDVQVRGKGRKGMPRDPRRRRRKELPVAEIKPSLLKQAKASAYGKMSMRFASAARGMAKNLIIFGINFSRTLSLNE